MELSPEEYGAYWSASIRVAAGAVVVFFGHRVTAPFLAHPEAGATALGAFVFVAVVAAGTFLACLGLARLVRVAVAAELR